jgi:small subunit ribosomal protein S16
LAVKLRLTRRGKKKQPFYRIVAADSRTARDGKYIEKIGLYNPLPDPAEILIDEEKAFYWLNQGAVPSDTVKNLLSKKGIILKWSLKKRGFDEAKVDEEFQKWEAIQIEEQKKKDALAAQALREKEDKKDTEEKDDKAGEPVEAKEKVEEKIITVEAEEKDEKAEEPVEAEEQAGDKPETVEADEKVEDTTVTAASEEKIEVKENEDSAPEEEVTETKAEDIEPGTEQPVAENSESEPEENLSTPEDENEVKEKE